MYVNQDLPKTSPRKLKTSSSSKRKIGLNSSKQDFLEVRIPGTLPEFSKVRITDDNNLSAEFSQVHVPRKIPEFSNERISSKIPEF